MIPETTELDELLLYLHTTALEPHDEYTSKFTYKEQKLLWEHIKETTKYKDAWKHLKQLYNNRNYDFDYGITNGLLEELETKFRIGSDKNETN